MQQLVASLLLTLVAQAGSATDELQAVSLLGRPLVSAPASPETLANLAAARAGYERAPHDADTIIWLGRRTAYAGRFREAIRVYGEGLRLHPQDPRLYRHRGHRYITVREFDHAIADLERAVELIAGNEDEIEPDGLPNAQNIPLSTLHGNVWYHLGLAYYLQQDWARALRAFDAALASGDNDDNHVSSTHWRYMILRRMGRPADADAALAGIREDMHVIENQGYYELCLMYRGMRSPGDLAASNDAGGAAVAYGIANWHHYNGRPEQAVPMLEALAANDGWPAFGVIAAEADLAALRGRR